MWRAYLILGISQMACDTDDKMYWTSKTITHCQICVHLKVSLVYISQGLHLMSSQLWDYGKYYENVRCH